MAYHCSVTTSICQRTLQNELSKLLKEPLEGFLIEANEQNILEWDVVIFGPPDTPYAGGYFKAKMTFPQEYPYSPPKFTFKTSLWHPNVYMNGDVCISILHPPGEDPLSGELPNERWNPTQSVRTILLSVQSLLNEPNTSSAANVDASVMYRKMKEGKKGCDEYGKIVKEQVDLSRQEAIKDDVKVPSTLQEYLAMSKPTLDSQSSLLDRENDSGCEFLEDIDDQYYDDDDQSDNSAGQSDNETEEVTNSPAHSDA
eukprot:TRINITY_DN3374_c0_g1_i1.p1 TRINITY_DN3374_c0_g1~~TRINITY_DN3374_c0_g1_i1.p1  ORF type:complete len:256 (+),score=71.76 TRINITY_DN3374_c0_g1_i1:721-1488(+)